MIRRLAALTLMLALPTLAAAQYGPRRPRAYGPPPSGPTLSAWLGLGAPTGDISDEGDGRLGDVVTMSVPIGFGVGYRFNPLFHGELFFEGAPLGIHDAACAPGDPCNGSDFRLGVDAQLHLAPYQRADPWLALGVGYEWLRFDATGCDNVGNCFAERFRYDGWLFPRLSAGLRFAATPSVHLGPFLSYSAGQYANVETTSAGSQTINNRAFHGWLEIGIRGDFDL